MLLSQIVGGLPAFEDIALRFIDAESPQALLVSRRDWG
jgi:hypothetical protein